MSVLKALATGLRRTMGSGAPLLIVWLTVLLSALPGAVIMEELVRQDIGASLMHEDLRDGLDLGWLEEFHYRKPGLARTLRPSSVTSVAPFDNLEAWFSGTWFTQHRGLAAAGIGFLLVWIYLQGGILDHLAHPGRTFEIGPFMGAGGSYFFRFLRLGLLSGAAYFGIYRGARWLFPRIERLTQDVTVERTALAYHLFGAAAILLVMGFVRLVADYAKIATLREQRRSMLLAVLRSSGRVVRHPIQAFGLLGVLSALLLLLQGLYFVLAPQITGTTASALLVAFAVGQVYLILRWALRITLFGAEIHLFDQWSGRGVGRGGPYAR